MVSRRKTLQLVFSIITIGLVPGCLGLFQDGGVGIRIQNSDDREHNTNVIFKVESETVFSNQYTVSAGGEVETSDILEAGEYQVTVELDSGATKTVDFVMAGCDSNVLFIDIEEGGDFWVGELDEC